MNSESTATRYPICATPDVLRRAWYDDIDEQSAQLAGHDQLYQQLSPGSFRGRFITAQLSDDAYIFVEQVNQTLLQQGSVPRHLASFMFLMDEESHCNYQGEKFGREDLAVMPGGSSFEGLCFPRSQFCVITVDPKGLGNEATARGLSSSATFILKAQYAAAIVGQLRVLIRGAMTHLDCGLIPKLRVPLFSTLASAMEEAEVPRIRQTRSRFLAARDFIHEHLREVTVLDLCLALKTPRRTVELCFHREVGIGPSRYIRALRLNNIRRAIASTRKGQSVADIAASWGIWHPGHFIARYREMFGERPSDTKRRSQKTRTT